MSTVRQATVVSLGVACVFIAGLAVYELAARSDSSSGHSSVHWSRNATAASNATAR